MGEKLLEAMGIKIMVPKKGLEPPHPCGYMDLNHARLPIPPLRRVTFERGAPCGTPCRKTILYSTDTAVAVKQTSISTSAFRYAL
jgi:hypothetical protein